MDSSKISKLDYVIVRTCSFKGIDLFETYATFVQCTIICLMRIIEIILQFKSKQGDITDLFIQGKLEGNEELLSEMRKVFEQYEKCVKRRVLRLKKTLHGLRQSPRDF